VGRLLEANVVLDKNIGAYADSSVSDLVDTAGDGSRNPHRGLLVLRRAVDPVPPPFFLTSEQEIW
jgi:hypothetical protein